MKPSKLLTFLAVGAAVVWTVPAYGQGYRVRGAGLGAAGAADAVVGDAVGGECLALACGALALDVGFVLVPVEADGGEDWVRGGLA